LKTHLIYGVEVGIKFKKLLGCQKKISKEVKEAYSHGSIKRLMYGFARWFMSSVVSSCLRHHISPEKFEKVGKPGHHVTCIPNFCVGTSTKVAGWIKAVHGVVDNPVLMTFNFRFGFVYYIQVSTYYIKHLCWYYFPRTNFIHIYPCWWYYY